MIRILFLALLVLGAGGCQSLGAAFSNTVSGAIDLVTGGDETADPPRELEALEAEVAIEVLWDADVGGGDGGQLLGLGASGEGDRVYAADHEGQVVALSLREGDEIWETDTGLPLAAGPSPGADTLLVGTSEAQVAALDKADGALRWTAPVSSEVLAPPKAAHGIVVVHAGDGGVFALDERSGGVLWSLDRRVTRLSLRGAGAPAIVEDSVLVGFANGRMAALRLSDGKVVWERQLAVPGGVSEVEGVVDIDSTPVVRDHMVYVTAYYGGVIAASSLDGEVIWRNGRVIASAAPAVTPRYVFVTDTSGDVWGLDETTGRAYWKQTALHRRQLTAPVVYRDWLVVGDYEGYVHILAQEDGRLVGRKRVSRHPIRAAPVVIEEVVVIYSSDGDLAALKIED